MPTDTQVGNLVINILSKEQYDGIATKSESELYFVPDGIPIINQTESIASISPNCLNIWGEMASLTINLVPPTNDAIVNEYMIQFISGSTATTLSLPSTIKWVVEPYIEANATYQISIMNNLGVLTKYTEV